MTQFVQLVDRRVVEREREIIGYYLFIAKCNSLTIRFRWLLREFNFIFTPNWWHWVACDTHYVCSLFTSGSNEMRVGHFSAHFSLRVPFCHFWSGDSAANALEINLFIFLPWKRQSRVLTHTHIHAHSQSVSHMARVVGFLVDGYVYRGIGYTHLNLNWLRIFCTRFCGRASRLVDELVNNNKLIYSASIAVSHSVCHRPYSIWWIAPSYYYYYYYYRNWHRCYCYYYCCCSCCSCCYCWCSHHYQRIRWTKASMLTTCCYINRRPSYSIHIYLGFAIVSRLRGVRAFSCVCHHFSEVAALPSGPHIQETNRKKIETKSVWENRFRVCVSEWVCLWRRGNK